MAEILYGAPVASEIKNKTQAYLEECRLLQLTPQLALVRFGEDPDDLAYEASLIRACQKNGILCQSHSLAKDSSQVDFDALMRKLNDDQTVHGILVFQPLPSHIHCENAVDPQKDIDGTSLESQGHLYRDDLDCFTPCTAEAIMAVLKHYGIDLDGQHAVVISRSRVIGKPLALKLLKANATVTVCHTHTKNLPALCRQADILISGCGKANLITSDFLHPEQIVIDAALAYDERGGMCGDVCFAQAEKIVRAISPVPKGVGEVTTALLIQHVVLAALKRYHD